MPKEIKIILRNIAELHLQEFSMNPPPHLAGDESFKRKMYKKFCQLRLNLLIKISYIPDFENV